MRSCRQGQALGASQEGAWGGRAPHPLHVWLPQGVSLREWGLSAGSVPRAALTHSDR